MKTFFKAILGVVVIGSFIGLLAYGLNYLQKPGPLENIEKRMDEAAEKESVLTDKEVELKQKSQNKEWEEVDKETDK
tara:strand:- start:88 stop:318 length:231 start_codon:yes stop_codon:yes gene_type:complete